MPIVKYYTAQGCLAQGIAVPINLLQKKHAKYHIILNCLMSHKFGQNSTKESGTQLFLLKKKK